MWLRSVLADVEIFDLGGDHSGSGCLLFHSCLSPVLITFDSYTLVRVPILLCTLTDWFICLSCLLLIRNKKVANGDHLKPGAFETAAQSCWCRRLERKPSIERIVICFWMLFSLVLDLLRTVTSCAEGTRPKTRHTTLKSRNGWL